MSARPCSTMWRARWCQWCAAAASARTTLSTTITVQSCPSRSPPTPFGAQGAAGARRAAPRRPCADDDVHVCAQPGAGPRRDRKRAVRHCPEGQTDRRRQGQRASLPLRGGARTDRLLRLALAVLRVSSRPHCVLLSRRAWRSRKSPRRAAIQRSRSINRGPLSAPCADEGVTAQCRADRRAARAALDPRP